MIAFLSFLLLPFTIAQAQTLGTLPPIDQQWLNLLHTKKTWTGGQLSQVDGEEFFISPRGVKDPQEELNATYEAFVQSKTFGDKHEAVGCRFPARRLWFWRRLPVSERKPFEEGECESFRRFKKSLDAHSVSLVFSSYYINNPSSSFGHTLLRINRSGPRFELLDHGINYAANATTDNALLYAISGLAGFFRGTFTNVPYYYKVREYNDFEVRDLWSYDLNLTPDEIEMLVAHAWELGSTYFDYYYLTENCSYHMLSLLEAAAPRLNLTDRLAYWVIPADTVKVAYETPGLVSAVSYRASSRSQFEKRLESLNAPAKEALQKIAALHNDKENFNQAHLEEQLTGLEQSQQIAVLDAAADYLDFKNPEDVMKESTQSSREKRLLLLTRSKFRMPSQPLDGTLPTLEMPHFGHGSARAGIGFGYENSGIGSFTELNMRFALHDLLDPTQGYPEDARIEFLHFRGRINQNQFSRTNRVGRWFELNEATLFRVTSLNPLRFYNKSPSWRVEFGMRQVRDLTCDRCYAGFAEFGIGETLGIQFGPRVNFYGLLDSEFMVSPSFENSAFRMGVGPRIGALARLTHQLKFYSEARYRYLFFMNHHHFYAFNAALRWFFEKRFAVELQGNSEVLDRDASLKFYYYF